MLKPSIPSDENERIAALGELGILDTPPEERFDRYTRLIKRVLDVPIALVSLVDENRQWFKSCQGLDVSETPRDVSFCGHAILKSDPFVVADALADERFADNPLVTGGPGVRFYAGVPLTAPGGQRIGTLCAIDRKPRALSPDDLAVLTDVASMVDSELAALMLATTDPLTQISNRRGFESIGSQALAMVRRQSWCAVLLYFDLDGFKEINDRHGHAEGDRALQEFAGLLRSCFRECDVIARMGGDEFCVLLSAHQAPHVDRALGRFETALSRHNAESDTGYDLEYSVGAISFDTACHPTVSDLVADADRKMYERKTARRKRRDDPPRQGAA